MAEIKSTTASKRAPRKRATDRQDGGATTQPVAEAKEQPKAWEEVAQLANIYELNNTDRRVVVVFAESDDAPAIYRGIHSNARVSQGKPALLLDNGAKHEL
ncbi:hypothetical protein [Oligella urethralis]|uniref:hypothetical protein n=1 Tax=Oligella urethralis TaxID=90245 RepID=UPI000DFD9DF5|nr:hypothetical protein [Oligella urethralis]SUA58280.1 Uncharacterised protein [Oligella urethralis]